MLYIFYLTPNDLFHDEINHLFNLIFNRNIYVQFNRLVWWIHKKRDFKITYKNEIGQ